MDFHHKNNEKNNKYVNEKSNYDRNEKHNERNNDRNNERNNERNDRYDNKNDRKRKDRHQKRKNRKYSSSSLSRPSSSVSVSVSQSESSSSSEKVPRYRPKNHDNMVLLLENLPENLTKQQLDSAFNEAAMEANVIPHEEISIINAFGQAYIKYCTVDYARKVLIYLKGKISIGEHTLNVDFYDDTSGRQRRNRHELKNSLINQPPTSYDWICDKCGYENFAKRHKCNKCLNPRNINCKILSVMMAPTTGFTDDSLCNTSLMIKAKSIADATDSDILDIFAPLAAVKDIRLVKNKVPKDPRMKEQKDFAFVEFFSVEDAENVYRYVTQNEVRLHGDQLIIQYSRNNRASRYEDHQKPFGFYPNNQFVMQQQGPLQPQIPSQQSQQPQDIIQQQQQPQIQIPIPIQMQMPIPPPISIHQIPQIPPLPYNQPTQTQPIPQLPIQMSEVSIVQPIIQAPYQAAQLAQERIILKQEQKLTLSTPPMNLMSTLLPKIHNPKPQQQQLPIQQQSQQQKKQQNVEETEEDVKSDKEDDQPSTLPTKTINKVQPQLTEAQIRKKAELELKKWEKLQQTKKPEVKVAPLKPIINQVEAQTRLILYICPICRRKFPSEEVMNYHSLNSEMHKQKLLSI
ncbi:unnamed protein product (macronuclear) [Paramecium tetraurelia]|uniref:RanBP2-type domain-containing protein n=1 Tax=Paramecium tetraurelia TaxID=5888 RepID=A0DKE7_PARTE|nr:uncharacterized protein GSPATT00017843001 [Paramecium tetraurelia]CAK83514.1 unnamed protein product [Paramecium tetraurelia]|eukprot:XP_001450911.1 hypothetical protein (macronuclear) [Paramecium tetraurelia strain d4-2]